MTAHCVVWLCHLSLDWKTVVMRDGRRFSRPISSEWVMQPGGEAVGIIDWTAANITAKLTSVRHAQPALCHAPRRERDVGEPLNTRGP